MTERAATDDIRDGEPSTGVENKAPLYLTIAILAIMGLALAVDATSVPGLVLLVVVLIGSLIAALAYYG